MTGYTLALQTGNTTFSTSGNTFTIQAATVPQNIVVSYTKGNNSNCTANQTFTIPVLSVAGQIPTVSGVPGQLVRGRSSTFTLSASHFYSFRGTNDPLEVASYTWAFSSGGTGWSISTANGTNSNGTNILRKFATFTTDNCSPATISIFSTDHCGNTSLTATFPISRFTEQASLSGVPSSVVCCQIKNFDLNASQTTSGLAGYSYLWDFGSWSGLPNGSESVVKSNGTSGTTISLTSVACGIPSGPTTKTVNIVPIEPSSTITGKPRLCNNEQGTYEVTPSLENCAVSSWSVSPANAVSPSQGTGNLVSFTTNPDFNGTISINYNITTPCGATSLSKSVHIGKPIIEDIVIPPCFNRYTYYTLQVVTKGAASIRWTVPACSGPRPIGPPGTLKRECWAVVDQMPTTSPYVRIYSGEQSGHISVWVSNECGEVSRSIRINWCDPREDGGGPIQPRPIKEVPLTSADIKISEENVDEIIFLEDRISKNDHVLKVYPNPTSNQFEIYIDAISEDQKKSLKLVSARLLDLEGKLLKSLNITDAESQKFDLTEQKAGIYMLSIEFSDHSNRVVKLIKTD